LGLDYKDYVTQDPLFMRAEELKYLCGDSTKLRETFGWEPEYTFETLMDEMIEHWLEIYNKEK
jgi:GDPmannose 4,6-dehydratase